MKREILLKKLSQAICELKTDGPTLVGIDGVDGAGKTYLADELLPYIEEHGRKVARASIDGFHQPREVRVAKGAFSPEGYFEDSFDYEFLISQFLRPLKSVSAQTRLVSAKYDWRLDRSTEKSIEVDTSTVVLFEGVFLFRPELESFWDFKIYVQIDPMLSLNRGLIRDSEVLGGQEVTREKYLKRYIPGQKIYHEKFHPETKANFLIKNDDPINPEILLEQ